MALWTFATCEGKIMVSETRVIRRSGLSLAAAAACLFLTALPGAGPARAADADNPWNSFLGWFGMGPHKPADDAIDYSARPALVVPPKMDLPSPQTAVARPADWPNDPDAAARRRAEADSRRPAPPAPPGDASTDDSVQPDQPAAAPAPAPAPAESELTGDKQASVPWGGAPSVASSAAAQQGTGDKRVFAPWGGHSGAAASAGPQQDCNQIAGMPVCLGSWDWFGFAKSDDTKAARTLKVGVEPPREYLIQPPPGYRAPVAVDTDTDSDKAQDAKDSGNAAPPAAGQQVAPLAGQPIGKTVSTNN